LLFEALALLVHEVPRAKLGPALREQYAAHSTAKAERFALDPMVDQTVAVYEETLARAAWRPTRQQPAA
jgi:hypothetical protein